MPPSLLFSVRALVVSFLCTTVFSWPNQPRVEGRDLVQREDGIKKRRLCFDDDTLLSFKYWILDSEPYCSSLLGIEDVTATVPQISRTTTTVVSTRVTGTVTTTSTEASVTVLSTTYVPSLLPRDGPDPTPTPFYQDNPYAYSVLADDVNAAIASSYFSACSCLYLTPSTIDSISVTRTTRTITGSDLQEATDIVIVTTGTSTLTLTRAGNPPATVTVSSTVPVLPTPLPNTDTSVTVPLITASISVGTEITSGLPSAPGFNSSLTLSNTLPSSLTSPTIAPSLNSTSFSVPSLTPTIAPTLNSTSFSVPSLTPIAPPTLNSTTFSVPSLTPIIPSTLNSTSFSVPSLTPIVPPTLNSTTFSVPSLTPTVSANITSLAPFPTGNQSSINLPTSGSPPFPTGNQSSSYLPSSGLPVSGVLPTLSLSSTISSRPISGVPLPSINGTSLPLPTSGSPIPSSNATSIQSASAGLPTAPANLSTIITPTLPQPSIVTVTSLVSTGFSQYPVNASVFTLPPALSVTSISVPANATIPSTISTTGASATGAEASALPTLDPANCPGLNGTLVTLSDGQQFAVVCETSFGGPVDIGLVASTFQGCVENCGNANNGFSAVRCRGVTYDPDIQGSQNCFYKNAAALLESTHTRQAVSAILINYK
ncbi:MAG: hypothetical protein Q9173_003539, partial [Seirophora scorigena]